MRRAILGALGVLGLFIATTGFASEVSTYLPPSFATDSGRAVFTDFKTARYQVTYDVKKREAASVSNITFSTSEEGFALFDSVQAPTEVRVDGSLVSTSIVASPDRKTSFRMIQKNLAAGDHVLQITAPLAVLKWADTGVASGFFMNDLSDRFFLERYLPSSFEYDPYQMTFDVSVIGTTEAHEVFTNGKAIKKSDNHWSVDFSEKFSCSSVYFHIVESSRYTSEKFDVRVADGRMIPTVVYGQKTSRLQQRSDILRVKEDLPVLISKMEKDLGSWPHSSITIYLGQQSGLGGMEYSGATMTEEWALSHELAHSYYARGVMPRDGSSGWIDEAVVTWYSGKPSGPHDSDSFLAANLAGFGPYNRLTSRDSYGAGGMFIAYLNTQMKTMGGIQPCLSQFFNRYVFDRVTTDTFKSEIEKCAGRSFAADFLKGVYGKTDAGWLMPKSAAETREFFYPIHKVRTVKEVIELM